MSFSTLLPMCGKVFPNSKFISIRIHVFSNSRNPCNILSNKYLSTLQKTYWKDSVQCRKTGFNGRAQKSSFQTTWYRIFHASKSVQNAVQSIKSAEKLGSKIPSSAKMEIARLMGLAKTEKWTLTGKER